MYVHLGNNYVISASNIIAILNIEPPISADLQDILDFYRSENSLINVSDKGKEKALIICVDNIYISPISSTTLYKRAFNYYKEV